MSTIGTVANSGNRLVDSLVWGSSWVSGSTPNVITVGYSSIGAGSLAPTAAEIAAINTVLSLYEHIINVDFQFVGLDDTYAADITFDFLNDTLATGNLGEAQPPGEGLPGNAGNPNSSVMIYRDNYEAGPTASLKSGSYDLVTLVHEFGHALGLAHPHDTGGYAADASLIFPGVTAAQGDYGNYNLNQGLYTVMSYNDGWATGPTKPSGVLFGYQTGPMALDIMALQYIYGARASYQSGSNTYNLVAKNAAGTGFTCLYDTGGTDTIAAPSASLTAKCMIDLRAATGLVADGGGGYVSYVAGIVGGFTIAKGVVIERAYGAAGADSLTGNAFDNLLVGRGGRDVMAGGGGADVFDFNSVSESGATMATADLIRDFNIDVDRIDLRSIDARPTTGVDDVFAFRGTGGFTGAGQVRVMHSGADTYVLINTDPDMTAESVIHLLGNRALAANDFLL